MALLSKPSKLRRNDDVLYLGVISRKSYEDASSDPAVQAVVTRALSRFRHLVGAAKRHR